MHETPADLERMQALIDASHARGSAHLRSIFFDARRSVHDGLRACYADVYGDGWEAFRQGNVYWRIDADRMFTFGGVEASGDA